MYKRNSGPNANGGRSMADVVQHVREASRMSTTSPVPPSLNPDTLPPMPGPQSDELEIRAGSQTPVSLSSTFRESQDREYETDLVTGATMWKLRA